MPVITPKKQIESALLQAAKFCLFWIFCAWLAWFFVLLVPGIFFDFPRHLALATPLSFWFALFWIFPLISAPHLLHHAIAHSSLKKWASLITTTAIAAAATPSILHLTASLAAGEWISRQSFAGLFRLLASLTLIATNALLWLWHARLSSWMGENESTRPENAWLFVTALVAIAIAGLLAALSMYLEAYSQFAISLLPFVGVATATFAGLLLSRLRRMFPRGFTATATVMTSGAAVWTLILAGGSVPLDMKNRVVNLTTVRLVSNPSEHMLFDIRSLKPSDCVPPGAKPTPRSGRPTPPPVSGT